MGKEGRSHDPKRIYYSDVKDENLLDTIVGKVTVVRVPSKVRAITFQKFDGSSCGVLVNFRLERAAGSGCSTVPVYF